MKQQINVEEGRKVRENEGKKGKRRRTGRNEREEGKGKN